eukprot:scaffold30465_cov112-Isochrysis_galbana.AAC.1
MPQDCSTWYYSVVQVLVSAGGERSRADAKQERAGSRPTPDARRDATHTKKTDGEKNLARLLFLRFSVLAPSASFVVCHLAAQESRNR